MLKFVVIVLCYGWLSLSLPAQTSKQIRERIAAEKPPMPVKKTKAEKKAEKDAQAAAKKNKNQPVDEKVSSLPNLTEKRIPDDVVLSDGLTESEAISLALWNNAQFNLDLSTLGFARADLTEAGLLRNPVLSLLFPIGPRQIEAALSLPFEILWQRPKRVAAAKLNLERVAESLEQNGLNLVRDVRLSFVELKLVRERIRLMDEALRTRREIPKIMEARFHVGDISEAELVTAHSELRIFEEDRIRFEREAGILKERLRLLVGLSLDQQDFEITTDEFKPVKFADTETLIREARIARPDIRAAELAIEAAGARAKLEKSRIYSLIAGLNIKSGTVYPSITTEIPILNRNQGGISRAIADLEQAMRQYALLNEQIASDIREAQARFSKSKELFNQLNQNVIPTLEREQKLQQATFENGEIPYLFVLQNKQRVETARIREIETIAEMNRSQIIIDRTVGRIFNDK